MRRGVIAGSSAVLLGGLLVAPAAAVQPPDREAEQTVGGRLVGIGGPETMVLRPGCRTGYVAGTVFDAVAGEEYWTTINAEDSTGRDIDGGIREGVVQSDGRVTVTAPLLLCGSVHDAGRGLIKVGLIVGDAIDEDLRKPVRIVYADRVHLKKTGKVTRVRKGARVELAGRWDRGAGFGHGLTTAVRKAVRVRLFFRPAGAKWREVASSGIDSQGRWKKRVKVRKTGKWRARIMRSDKLLPATSKTRKIKVGRGR